MWAAELGVQTAPVLCQTAVTRLDALRSLTTSLASAPSACGGQREGVVVRHLGGFADDCFSTSVAKWVRKGHVQSGDHWKNQVIVPYLTLLRSTLTVMGQAHQGNLFDLGRPRL